MKEWMRTGGGGNLNSCLPMVGDKLIIPIVVGL